MSEYILSTRGLYKGELLEPDPQVRADLIRFPLRYGGANLPDFVFRLGIFEKGTLGLKDD